MTTAPAVHRPGRRLNLCFHGVGRPGRPLEEGEDSMWITAEQLAEIVEAAASHPRDVGITFDDGNESDFTEALPVLQRFEVAGQFFVIAGRLDTAGSLSREQVEGLSDAGQGVGTHGMHHRRWRELTTSADIEEEIFGAAAMIEEVIGGRVTGAACPNGSYDRRVLGWLKPRYDTVYTVDGGSASASAWLQSRHTVGVGDDGTTITALLDRPDGRLDEHLTRSVKQLVKRWR